MWKFHGRDLIKVALFGCLAPIAVCNVPSEEPAKQVVDDAEVLGNNSTEQDRVALEDRMEHLEPDLEEAGISITGAARSFFRCTMVHYRAIQFMHVLYGKNRDVKDAMCQVSGAFEALLDTLRDEMSEGVSENASDV
jgi:hypothetical protein